MGINPEEIIEIQKQQWNRVAPAWDKWDELLDRNLSFINYRLTGDARIRKGFRVLDLGCGTGYPALLIAEAVGSNGEVIGLDLAEDMLAVARQKAGRFGMTNVRFQQADITALPFEDHYFDAVTSRFCLMFLPEIPKAVAEITRVLKPGGYMAAAVWSDPSKNPFIQIPMDVLSTLADLPKPPSDSPGIFRLANPGELMGIFQRGGLEGLSDEEVLAENPYTSSEEYFTNLMEMAAPLQPLFEGLSPEKKLTAEFNIKKEADSFKRGTEILLPIAIRIVVARKAV